MWLFWLTISQSRSSRVCVGGDKTDVWGDKGDQLSKKLDFFLLLFSILLHYSPILFTCLYIYKKLLCHMFMLSYPKITSCFMVVIKVSMCQWLYFDILEVIHFVHDYDYVKKIISFLSQYFIFCSFLYLLTFL